MKYIRIYTESKSMNNYYYEEQTGEMFILEQSKGGNGLSVGIIAGISLAVIQVLMYDLNLLKPCFDIYDFADEHKELEINTDSYTVIEPALNFFRELSIPREFAHYVEKIDMDGGNEVYMNIIPQWDGEDECFDLNNITSSEIRQFPNLKEATIMSSNFDKVKEIFVAENIDVELL